MRDLENEQLIRETKLLNCLKKLGNSSTAIAKNLLAQKIVGKLESNKDCPIANHLKRLRYKDVNVHPGWVNCKTRSGMSMCVDHTEASASFVENFDSRKYPKLIRDDKFSL